MSSKPVRTSGADIVVPSSKPIALPANDAAPRPSITPAMVDTDSVEQNVRLLLEECETNDKDALCIIAISALIENGINTGPAIVSSAVRIGFKPDHAGAILKHSSGSNPACFEWHRDGAGIYHTHAAALKPAA